MSSTLEEVVAADLAQPGSFSEVDILDFHPKQMDPIQSEVIDSFQWNEDLVICFSNNTSLKVNGYFNGHGSNPDFIENHQDVADTFHVDDHQVKPLQQKQPQITSEDNLMSLRSFLGPTLDQITDTIETLDIRLMNPSPGDVLYLDQINIPEGVNFQRIGFSLEFSNMTTMGQLQDILKSLFFQYEEHGDRVLTLFLKDASGNTYFTPMLVDFEGIAATGQTLNEAGQPILESQKPIFADPPQHGGVIFDEGGMTYLPIGQELSPDYWSYLVVDLQGNEGVAYIHTEIEPLTDEVEVEDQDNDNSFYMVNGPRYGRATFQQDGSISYQSNRGNFRDDKFMFYRITEGKPTHQVTMYVHYELARIGGFELNDEEDFAAFQNLLTAALLAGALGDLVVTTPPPPPPPLLPTAVMPSTNINLGNPSNPIPPSDPPPTPEPPPPLPPTDPPGPEGPFNTAPLAQPDQFSVNENGQLVISLPDSILNNDSDPEGDTLEAILVTQPANGTLTLNPDGTFTYTPDAGFSGIDTFTYVANDGTSDSNIVTVTINVIEANDPPAGTNDEYEVNEDTTLTIPAAGVLANDIDPDGDPLEAILVTDVANGTLTLNADGSFEYTPDENFNGIDTFTYIANDGTEDSEIITVTINVNPINDVPIAAPDEYNAIEDTELVIQLPEGILSNDTDVDGDTLNAILVTDVSNGILNLNADGSFEYQPDQDFTGIDTFTYMANDGSSDSNIVTVTINVAPVNDAPIAQDDQYETNEDTTLNIPATGVIANDSDVDGDPLEASLVTDVANGTLTLNADGSFEYIPDANFNGEDTFTYLVNDGTENSNTVTVTIIVNPVNDLPVAEGDAYQAIEDTELVIPLSESILNNDTDIDGDTLAAILVQDVQNGILNLNEDGTFEYLPDENFNGIDFFTYLASDGSGNSNIVTVTIDVIPVNDAPIAQGDEYETNEDTTLIIPASGVIANDSDVDGDPLEAILVSDVANGTLTLNADGSFTYIPDDNYNGEDSFTYMVNDGTENSNVVTVNITVNPINDAPIAIDDLYQTAEDTALIVPNVIGVVANDEDIDGDPLEVILIDDVANGILNINADGSFSYQPDENFNGVDTFTYMVNDGTENSNVATVTINVTSENDAPIAIGDEYITDEDTTLNIPATGILANDSDADGNPITAILVSDVSNGTLTLNSDGSFEYIPDENFNGEDSFTYKANDGSADSNTVTVTITVTPQNDAPIALGDQYQTTEDTTLNIPATGILANDTDVDGDPLEAILVTDVANGTLTLNADGSFDYTPDENFNGQDSFTYKANDGSEDSNIVTVTIDVTAENDAPIAEGDAYETDEDTALIIPTAGVLANDSDIDGDPLDAILVTDVANGTLTLNADGSFEYIPDENFNGEDSFTYKANDGGLDSNTVTVTITVNPTNDAPIAEGDIYETDEDTILTISAAGVLANDEDIDGDPLDAILVTDVANGTLTLNADGSFEYIPDENFNGQDSFTYKANDGTEDSNTVTVIINVNPTNDAPTATEDLYQTAEDTELTVPASGILANDSDVDGDPLEAILVTDVANGTLTLNADGSFTYIPDENFNGVDTFTYKANDGTEDSNIVEVTITVTSENDAPIAEGDAYETDEDVELNIPATGVLANDDDIDGDPLEAILVTDVTNGSLTLNADGSFTYIPDENFNGQDSFTYQANDGTTNSNIVTVTIDVNPINDAPTAEGDAYETDEDTTLIIPAAGVLANDDDIDGDPLDAILVTDVANGTLTLNADGSFEYIPDENFNGQDSFTYKANDGSEDSNTVTVTIDVNPVNDAPIAEGDNYQTDEDTTLNIPATGVLANDDDVDGDPLESILVQDVSNGTLTLNADGSFQYIPDENFNGEDTFTYQANDGSANSEVVTVTITVNPINDAPIAEGDAYETDEDVTLNIPATGVLANDEDIDGDPLESILVTDVSNGTLTLNADGSFEYIPDENFNGEDSFTYMANDGTENSEAVTVTITVNPINDAPTGTDDFYETDEDVILNIPAAGVLANDEDIDGDPLESILVTDVSNGTLSLNADGSFSYEPDENFNGTDTFTYMANDGTENSEEITVTIQVNPMNDAPIATDDFYETDEDVTLNIPADGVLDNDEDIDGDPLESILVQDVTHGTLTLNADGSFEYIPDENFNGLDTFTYIANDGTENSEETTVTIQVNPMNDAPIGTDDFYETDEDIALIIPPTGVLANDDDVDGDPLESILVQDVANGTLTLNDDGSFEYIPDENFNGEDTFTYIANDGTENSEPITVTITVNPVNDAPDAVDDEITVNEDTPTIIPVLDNDSDIDGDPLEIINFTQPPNGEVVLNPDGTFTYTPDDNYNGEDTFTYTISDGNGGEDTATVNINVLNTNDDPDAVDDHFVIDEDVPTIINVLNNDSDPDGNNLNIINFTQPPNGEVVLNQDSTFTYTPDENYFGFDSFTYTISDGNGGEDTATVTIEICAVDDAPIAQDDEYIVSEDHVLQVPADGVLANDEDPDGDNLTANLLDNVDHGDLTFNSDGSFTYIPDEDFSGIDTFTYEADDGGLQSGETTVTIFVDAVADMPGQGLEGGTSGEVIYEPLMVYSIADAPGYHGETTLYKAPLGSDQQQAVGPLFPGEDDHDVEALTLAEDGYLYAGDDGDIYQIDPDTGLATLFASLPDIIDDGDDGNEGGGDSSSGGSSGGSGSGSVDYDSIQGMVAVGDYLYGGTIDGDKTHYFRVDLSTGEAIALGSTWGELQGLAYDPVEDMFIGAFKWGNSIKLKIINNIDDLDTENNSLTPLLDNHGDYIYLPGTVEGLAFLDPHTLMASERATGNVYLIDLNTFAIEEVDDVFGSKYFFSDDGIESLAVGSGQACFIQNEDEFTLAFNTTFGDFLDGSEEHYILIAIPDASWYVSGGTLVVNPDGFPPGTYIRIDADGSINQATGEYSGQVVLQASLDQQGLLFEDVTFDIYAVAEEVDTLPGDDPSDNLAYDQTSTTVLIIQGDSIIFGTHGDDEMEGSTNDDLMLGKDGDDWLPGCLGDDLISGGAGNDVMAGNEGSNTFIWMFGDQGTVAIPAWDWVLDFKLGEGEDIFDFSGMLQGEENGTLSDYLSFFFDGQHTEISVSPLGDGDVEQIVVVENVDLTEGGSLATDMAIINSLLDDSQLVVDV